MESTLQKESWLDRLDQRLAALKSGEQINSRDLFNAVQAVKDNDYGRSIEEVNHTDFALAMAERVATGKVNAEFDGKRTVLYSPVEPI
jgi:DNA-binding IclR family transcriptional regulator